MIVSIADRGLADLTVADDQLALTLTDRNERVDRADAGLHRLLDRLPLDDGGRGIFDRAILGRRDRPLTVDRIAERIDDAAEERLTDGNRGDAARAPDLHAFFDLDVGSEDDDADVILFEVERDALQAVRKFDELRLLYGFEPVHARDARADLDDGSDLIFVNFTLEVRDLPLKNTSDFIRVDHKFPLNRGGVPPDGPRVRTREPNVVSCLVC